MGMNAVEIDLPTDAAQSGRPDDAREFMSIQSNPHNKSYFETIQASSSR